ncbi:AzlC family ABC transporter permease [Pseudoruegeria sp. SHC-113]|uniref:AzlC family ABC transporter permease n=1 Tax=Pseudoruegeria sp. SHC-113 TaxID=2855439 RepID=UPI0021BB857E|nr:AzlC family ABC transporter permease [Pseudoruegeria sp. SHC-113]MCT8159661.1 AzlC family ABC transporter permease [Pseudoruegeria sp. SHC-113]
MSAVTATSTPPSPLQEALLGVRDMLPLAFAVATYGAAFGVLSAQGGLSLGQSGVFSALVFGGSAQMIALERLGAGAGALAAVMAGVALNLRMLLTTAAMREALSGQAAWKIALGAHLTTDASAALLQMSRAKGLRASYWYLTGGGLLLYVTWVAVTLAGYGLSGFIASPERLAVDFALAAGFVAMLPGLWRGSRDLRPWAGSAATVCALMLLTPLAASWALILGALAGAFIAGVQGDE